MGIDITFHGAAGTVTGSCIELRTGRHHILIDCGMFQGSRSLEALNYEPLAFDPATLDLVILTHAHLDHSGKLPLLIREGCRAPIWCSPPSRQLLRPLLVDAANIQAADADRRNERPDRIGLPPFEPLYDFEDVAALVEQLHALAPEKLGTPLDGVSLRFWDAHHILGAVSVELNVEGQSLLFSGDIGDGATRLADPPPPAQGWDHVICEATYGDRDRSIPTDAERRELLAREVEHALAKGGNLIIPAFALERTQALVEDLVANFTSGRLTPSPVFVDAPLADRVTQAYRRFEIPPHGGPSPFDHPKVRFTRSVDESRTLNRISGAIIIAGSGMCSGGRIRYHLLRNLPRGDSTVLLVGYQARGTLGAALATGADAVRISGEQIPVRAEVRSIDAYSAHADHAGLLRWLARRAPVRGTVFLNHGEPPALDRLITDAGAIPGLPHPVVPLLGEQFRLAPQRPAERIVAPRTDAADLVAPGDWRNRYAAFSAGLEAQLRTLPSVAARQRALAAAEAAIAKTLAENTALPQGQEPVGPLPDRTRAEAAGR